MLTNREVFDRDPLKTTIPNDGMAKVVEPQTEQEWNVLRYELTFFVCEGEYRSGLERILSTYLANLGEDVQPAVWVSGFYGSGKSHLVRSLEHLWKDVRFPDGARARGLAKLPADIEAHLQELTIAGRREGGLWSAAGKIGSGAGDSVRLALLGILFRSAGLPEKYSVARFVIWLKQNGFYDAVKAGVETAGKSFDAELRDLYVSPVLAGSLISAYPPFANSEADARQSLKTQFPIASDVSDEEMVRAMDDVFALQSTTPGKMPLTLIVLDELQQYIGDDPDRTLRVQNVVEACSSRFGSRVLFVATGQQALQGTTQLSKLQGRFTVRVSLSDKDVETVVREVVLRKAEDKKPQIEAMLEACSGEIDRHLTGTKIAPTPSDRSVMVADYPLLPTRRRFWERVLRAVDRAGAAGQLRTQLRVVHEAVREVAEKPLGTVVAGDRIYSQLSQTMLQTGALLRDVDEIVRKQDDGTPEGILRSRLSAIIFLISQLPTDSGADMGIRATASMMADLLVEDLNAGSEALRQQIPGLLAGMVDDGDLILVGEEYHLQTRESAAWDQDYRTRYARIFADDTRIAGDRTTEIKNACAKALKDLAIPHGKSKTPRKSDTVFTAEEPKLDTGSIPLWIRDEWAVSEKTVREDAQAAGPDSPMIYIFLPRRNADELKRALAGFAAATETLHTHIVAATREAQEAHQSMVTRQAEQRRQLDLLIAHILKDARVYQGGGTETTGGDLRASALEAMTASLARMYPEFSIGDDPKWDKVKQRVKEGSGDPLSALGYSGDTDKHPVCQQVLTYIGGAGKKGQEVRKRFTGAPFGWSQDTVDGAILALMSSGRVRPIQNGTAVSVQQVDNAKLGQTEFRVEGATVTAVQRIALRKLLTDAGITVKPDEEILALPSFVAQMITLGNAAGADAPLPIPPSVEHLEALKALSGNDLALEVHEQRARFGEELTAWQSAKERSSQRLPHWQSLQRLLDHTRSLPIREEVTPQVNAIRANRTLLSDPDPVPPLCRRLTDELRSAVKGARQQHLQAYDNQIEALYRDPVWCALSDQDQNAIRAANGLGPLPELKVGTEAEVLAALDETPLWEWENRTAAIAERVARALLEAARRLEPQAVRVNVPPATLKTLEDVQAYLERVRTEIMEHIDAGHPVVI